MSVIPSQIVSSPKVKAIKGFKAETHSIYPTSATGNTVFKYSNQNVIQFLIPAYKGFFNPQRSFLRFNCKTSADTMMADGCPVFSRMRVMTGNGQLIENIDGYSAVQRALSNFDSVSKKISEAGRTGDFRANRQVMGVTPDLTTLKSRWTNGTLVEHELLSGVFGKEQEHFINLGMFNASGGYAFMIELHLEDPKISCVKDADATVMDYELSDVQFVMEVASLPTQVTDKMDEELANGAKVSYPFSTYRLHQSYIPVNSKQVEISISESAHDVENVMSLIRKQNLNTDARLADTTFEWQGIKFGDNLSFLGHHGDYTKSKTDATYAQLGAVDEWQYTYDTTHYPSKPCSNGDKDATNTLLHSIHGMDLYGKDVFASAVNGETGLPLWENGCFAIIQNFRRFRDKGVSAGLNSSSTGSPVQLSLTLKKPATEALRVENFVKSGYTLTLHKGGNSTLTQGGVAIEA